MRSPFRLALIAHDEKKDEMVAFAGRHADFLRRCEVVATGTTGQRISTPIPASRSGG